MRQFIYSKIKPAGFLIFFFLLFAFHSIAQLATGNGFEEFNDPNPVNSNSWKDISSGTHSGFVSVNEHFDRSAAPKMEQVKGTWIQKAWKGERVHTQALIYTTVPVHEIQLKVSDLRNAKGQKISKRFAHANFVRYVLTDQLSGLQSGCGIPDNLPTSLHADMIGSLKSFSIAANTSRPIWVNIDVPQNTLAGLYHGTLSIISKNYKSSHRITIEVLKHTLPVPKDWKFHLDLWQNPYSDARVYGVKPWSPEHFKVMKPNYTMLANAGQKVITATLIHDPWSSQTYDVYDGMVKWVKQNDGNWKFDYTVFDKWVAFMMSLGIDKQINCYSMIPWTLKFRYFDDSTGKMDALEAKPGSMAYKEHWSRMLIDFAKHLKEKKWFDITTIAMDERPAKDMQFALAIIKEADPEFKISMAGNYHPEIQADIYDYCIASEQQMSPQILAERRAKGFVTTFYTACPEIYPNAFTSSDYAELSWLPWHSLFRNFDGYLRWDYNNWNADPFSDSRFGKWAAGDTYFVYPGARSSIRFERLREGIQDWEKYKILKKELEKKGDTESLAKLEKAISQFDLKSLNGSNAHLAVDNARTIINSF